MPPRPPTSNYCPTLLRKGQRVTRLDSDEKGTIAEASTSEVKIRWDGGGTSYFRPGARSNMKLVEAD